MPSSVPVRHIEEGGEKTSFKPVPQLKRKHGFGRKLVLALACLALIGFYWHQQQHGHRLCSQFSFKKHPFEPLPAPNDPFQFLPCTHETLPPALDESNPKRSWARLYDANPKHWSWGSTTQASVDLLAKNPYAGRGIFLCGYLDLPLDYTNKSDSRIVRLAVTKYQISGLKHRKSNLDHNAGSKSKRTLVIEPGGPGGSGTSMAWRSSPVLSQKYTDSTFDVLGWDPRGVNASLPSASCVPFDADRDRWSLWTQQYREVYPGSVRTQLEIMDAMNDATFQACSKLLGDFPRFVSTAFVARDLEQIRIALDEPELSGYLVSYGTGIGQTYVNMFPEASGRIILDGTEYVRDQRLLGGFGFAALDNVTDAWHDGFLGECLNAGPKHCTLAVPKTDGQNITISSLDKRMRSMFQSILQRPMLGYTPQSGPLLITYSALVGALYRTLYSPASWPAFATMLSELESGNTTLAAQMLDKWQYDPTLPPIPGRKPSSGELESLVVCSDSYDAPLPIDGLDWWDGLWANMTEQSWIAGNGRFLEVFPCRHFTKYWPKPAEVYRGDLDTKLKNPVLLIAEAYDPATPLRNGRRLLEEMGTNARLIAHHGYGHSSRDTSNCTNSIIKTFLLNGILPDAPETQCYANEKPYLQSTAIMSGAKMDLASVWKESIFQ